MLHGSTFTVSNSSYQVHGLQLPVTHPNWKGYKFKSVCNKTSGLIIAMVYMLITVFAVIVVSQLLS